MHRERFRRLTVLLTCPFLSCKAGSLLYPGGRSAEGNAPLNQNRLNWEMGLVRTPPRQPIAVPRYTAAVIVASHGRQCSSTDTPSGHSELPGVGCVCVQASVLAASWVQFGFLCRELCRLIQCRLAPRCPSYQSNSQDRGKVPGKESLCSFSGTQNWHCSPFTGATGAGRPFFCD